MTHAHMRSIYLISVAQTNSMDRDSIKLSEAVIFLPYFMTLATKMSR